MMGKAPRVEVKFHGGLQRVFQEKEKQVDLSKTPDIRSLLEILCSSQERRRELFDDHGGIRSDLTILRNGRNIVFLSGLDTELNDGDAVAILHPLCGG